MAKKKTPDQISAPSAAPRRRAAAKKPVESMTATAGNGNSEPTQAEIAEAAYFRHLNRGGAQGDEFSDWIEAERELRQRHTR